MLNNGLFLLEGSKPALEGRAVHPIFRRKHYGDYPHPQNSWGASQDVGRAMLQPYLRIRISGRRFELAIHPSSWSLLAAAISET